MNPEDIHHVTMLKVKDAIEKYGEQAKHGAILDVTKKKNSEVIKNIEDQKK